MRTLPLSEVKAHLSEITDELLRTHERITVTWNGRDAIVLLSVADLESIEERTASCRDRHLPSTDRFRQQED